MFTHLFESNRMLVKSYKKKSVAVTKMERNYTCTLNYNLQKDRHLLGERNGFKQHVQNEFVLCSQTEHDGSLKDEYYEATANFSKDVRFRHAYQAYGVGPRSAGICAISYVREGREADDRRSNSSKPRR
jgi:hypothetical protein